MSDKKQAILEEVLNLLHHHTEETFTMSNLAKHLSIAKSTLYEYFDNKQTMIAQALSYLIETHMQELLALEGEEHQSFDERLKLYFNRLVSLTQKKRSMSSVMYHPEVGALSEALKLQVHAKVQEAYRLSETRLHEIIAQGHREGRLNKALSGGALHAVEALFFGSVIALADPFNQWDQSTLADDVIEALIKLHA